MLVGLAASRVSSLSTRSFVAKQCAMRCSEALALTLSSLLHKIRIPSVRPVFEI